MSASILVVLAGVFGISALPLKIRDKVLDGIAFAMIFDFVFLMFYYQSEGLVFATSILPLQLCSFVKWFCIITILTRSQGFFEMLLLVGMFVPFQSVVFPGFSFLTPYYLGHYFLIHLLFIITPVVFIRKYGMRPRLGSWWKAIGKILCVVPLIWVINLITGGNYMFVSAPPPVENPFTIGPWPIYFLNYIFLTGAVSWIIYMVVRALPTPRV